MLCSSVFESLKYVIVRGTLKKVLDETVVVPLINHSYLLTRAKSIAILAPIPSLHY